MAAAEAAQGEPAAPPGPVPLDRLQAVGAAAGDEATAGAEQGRNPALVNPNQGDQELGEAIV